MQMIAAIHITEMALEHRGGRRGNDITKVLVWEMLLLPCFLVVLDWWTGFWGNSFPLLWLSEIVWVTILYTHIYISAVGCLSSSLLFLLLHSVWLDFTNLTPVPLTVKLFTRKLDAISLIVLSILSIYTFLTIMARHGPFAGTELLVQGQQMAKKNKFLKDPRDVNAGA